ncbi:hypothetical protein [Microcoleus sp. herbarium5]|uniref:hypothetical protein n=1 Tax=Microcoleus sp. herbarium5 TaxID=3055434 RepID=UPI002FD5AEE6
MIQIKPNIQHKSNCPYSGQPLTPIRVFWPGMQTCVISKCSDCNCEFIEGLRVAHSVHNPYQIDLAKKVIWSHEHNKEWFVKPLLKALQNPEKEELEIQKEVFRECPRIIVLNCIDYLYGHCLLKLLNAQRHLDSDFDCGLVVIVPKFLRWMVPEGVSEVWTVNISLNKGSCYYPSFEKFVAEQFRRYDEIYISKAHSHPSQFDITRFTRVPKHDFEQKEFKISFVWREDRIWCNSLLFRIIRKVKMLYLGIALQNWKVRRLFEKMRERLPEAKFAVVGLGKTSKFPEWIEDHRVDKFDAKTEIEMCKVYATSRLVIGLHGSNMLLPSGHAGMTLDLIEERWGNFAQDILYQETDPRMATFRYRFLPVQMSISVLANIAAWMMLSYCEFKSEMTADVVDLVAGEE